MALRVAGNRVVTVPIIPQYDTGESSPVLVDLDRLQLVQLRGHDGRVFSARWIGEHQIITAGADHTVRRWDGLTGAPLQTYKGGSQYIADATLYDADTVVGGGQDGMLRFWDARSGELLWTLQAHNGPIVGLHVEGADLVTRGFNGQVERWNIPASEQVLAACRQHPRCAIVR
jgi:WD40 repeat protein